MHIIALGEGFPIGLDNFEKELHGKYYTNKKGQTGKLRMREFRFYDITFNEEVREEVLADLKDFTRSPKEIKTAWYGVKKYINTILKFFKKVKNIDKDVESIEPSGIRKVLLEEKNTPLPMWLMILGQVEDAHIKDGEGNRRELV